MRSTILLLWYLAGCSTHFTVQNAPIPPEQRPQYQSDPAEIGVGIRIANFTVSRVDTQYPKGEKELFARHFSVAIPNLLQELIGQKQVFRRVLRSATADRDGVDFVVTGDYDYFERLGTRGREWIPFYGMWGRINEVWIKATMRVQVIDTHSGGTILNRDYPEEARDRTRRWVAPRVGYLQGPYLAQIASDIEGAVRGIAERGVSTPPETRGASGDDAGALEQRLRALDQLRKRGLVSEQEYRSQRARLLGEL